VTNDKLTRIVLDAKDVENDTRGDDANKLRNRNNTKTLFLCNSVYEINHLLLSLSVRIPQRLLVNFCTAKYQVSHCGPGFRHHKTQWVCFFAG